MSSPHIPSNLLHSVANDDQRHVFARVCYPCVSWYAWGLERSTPSDFDLAHGHAVLFPGRKTVAELARWTPIDITEWRFRRLLKATYWDVHRLVDGWAHQAMARWPPPEDGVLTLTGDGRAKPKRGKKNPLAQKGRKSKHDPWFFGVRFALLMVSWDVFRLPVAFRLIRAQKPSQVSNGK